MRQLTPQEQRAIINEIKYFLKSLPVVDREKVLVNGAFLASGDEDAVFMAPSSLVTRIQELSEIMMKIPKKQFADMARLVCNEIEKENLLKE